MKKIFTTILFICFVLPSCITTTGVKETFFIDYKRYSDRGFFLTESNSVSFDYTPIASVLTVVKGEKQTVAKKNNTGKEVKHSARDRRESLFGDYTSKKTVKYSVYDALDELVSRSGKMGADGIINLKIIYTYDKDLGGGYDISGMAIKRKQYNN